MQKTKSQLSLTRRVGQGIRIGDSIRVSIVKASHGKVVLRIEAPPGVPVNRDEIAAQMTGGPISLARELRHADLDQLGRQVDAVA